MNIPYIGNLTLQRPTKQTQETNSNVPAKFDNFDDVKEKIVELSKIDIPTIVEDTRNGWVSYGLDNLFPLELMEFLDYSALHNAICINKSKLIAGDKFQVDGIELDEWEKTADLKQSIIVNSFIENAYSDNQNWYNLKRWMSFDYYVGGYCAIEVIWSENFSRIAAVNYIPWVKIRPGVKNNEGKIDCIYYSNDWSSRKPVVTKLQSFDINCHLPDGMPEDPNYVHPYSHNQMLYVKNHWPTQDYFGRPTYFGALTDIKSSEMIARWNLNSLDNGFTPSVLFSYPWKPGTTEQANKITNNIRNQFSPKKAMQKIAVMFSKSRDEMPVVTPMTVENIDKQMQELKKQVEISIVSGHNVTSPELLGIPASGGFSTVDLAVSWSLFYNNSILDEKRVMEEVMNMLLGINGFQHKVTFKVRNPLELN